jgi:hypothetical protein
MRKDLEDTVRRIVGAAGVAGALLFVACSESNQPLDEGFRKDLELAFTASPITLQESPEGAQVVSPIERTAPQVRKAAPSQRVAKHRPAPVRTQAPVEVVEADVSEEVEEAPVELADARVDDITPIVTARPQPVYSGGAGGGDGDYGRSRGEGIGTIIGVVLRGGHAGIDDCDPRVDGRRGRGGQIAINNRIPVVGTFPAGRIQGTFPGSGRLTASLPRGGRVRF